MIYVVAGSKPWNRRDFDTLAQTQPGTWLYVSTNDELVALLAQVTPRYVFFLHWHWHVPQDIWQGFECVCFHMTDVPYGRGGSPLQNLIVAGHQQTVVTALKMVEEMDAGPVYAKYPLSLEGRAEDIFVRAGAICTEIIGWMVANNPIPVAQSGPAVVFKRRQPGQSELPGEGNLRQLYDHIRMLDAPGYPLAFLERGDYRLEFSDAQYQDDALVARVVITHKPFAGRTLK